MATSDAPLSVPNVTLAVARGANGGSLNGQQITLTGSGFEAISNPRPTAYDNFNEYAGLVEGDQIPDSSTTFGFAGDGIRWTQRSNSSYNGVGILTTTNALPGRTFCITGSTPKWHTGNPIPVSTGPARSATGHYHTYMFAANEDLSSPPQPVDSRSDKWHRTWATGDFRVSFEPAKGGGTGGRLAVTNATDFYYPYTGTAESTPDVFHQVEEWIIGDQLWISVNGRKSGPYQYPKSTSTASAEVIYTELIGHDVSQSSTVNSTLRTFSAEFYEQPTPARVLLSNNATYDDTVEQRRFYQLCTSRTDTEIVIPEAFVGDLDSSQPIYAHIVKSDGTVIDYGQVN